MKKMGHVVQNQLCTEFDMTDLTSDKWVILGLDRTCYTSFQWIIVHLQKFLHNQNIFKNSYTKLNWLVKKLPYEILIGNLKYIMYGSTPNLLLCDLF